ncbi:MAG TPA: VOC family protein [Phenylobacterium sp.]|nr:VOC family protein [Phenylobacterium sp.]
MSQARGKFHWYELVTPDPAGAGAFYSKVVGWGLQDVGQGMSYTLLQVNGKGVAGIAPAPDGERAGVARPGWFGYIAVDDVDGIAAKVREAGGKVLSEPMDIPGILRFATVADPQGAVFFLYKGFAAEGPPTGGPDDAGFFGWRELWAGDGPKAFDFYSGLFGWTKAEAVDMGPMGTYQTFAADGETVGAVMTKPPNVPAPVWNYYIQVDSIGAAAERVKAAGGTVLMGPQEVPNSSWIIQGLDPQGVAFCLVSTKA